MGYLRFYRRVKVAPGVTVNFWRSGESVSVGGRGFHRTVGPHGTRTSVGVPGTGVGYVSQTSRRPPRADTAGMLAGAFGAGILQAILKGGTRRRR